MKLENTMADIDFDMEKYTCTIEVTYYIHYIKNILCFFVSNIDINFSKDEDETYEKKSNNSEAYTGKWKKILCKTGTGQYGCNYCNFKASSIASLTRHIDFIYQNSACWFYDGSKQMFNCNICEYYSPKDWVVKMHIGDSHPEVIHKQFDPTESSRSSKIPNLDAVFENNAIKSEDIEKNIDEAMINKGKYCTKKGNRPIQHLSLI